MLSSRCLVVAAVGCVLALSCLIQPTAAAAACGFEGLDFSALAGTDLTGSDGTTDYAYYLSVCGPVSSSAAADCVLTQKQTSACQQQTMPGQDNAFDLGNFDPASPPTWSYVDDTKKAVQYTMTGESKCYVEGLPNPYTTTVILQCADKQGDLKVTAPEEPKCNAVFTLETPHACGGGSSGSSTKKGLSGGWIFIIILCVVLPLYVLVGCIYKSQKLGATGMDKCPNVEFWRDLPSLVKEGCAFCVSKIRGLCGGTSSGSNTYETM